jgi:hypothetical protein
MRSHHVSPLASESRNEPAYSLDCFSRNEGLLASVGQQLHRFGWNIVARQDHVGIVASIGHGGVRNAVGLCIMSADGRASQTQSLVRSFLGVAEAISRDAGRRARVNLCLLLSDTYASKAPSTDVVAFLQASSVSAMYYLCFTSLLPVGRFATGPAVTMAEGIPFHIKIAQPSVKTWLDKCRPESIVGGSQLVLALKTLVSETLHPVTLPGKILCTGFRTTSALDIGLDGVEIQGGLRTLSNDIQTALQIRMHEAGAAICKLHGMRFFLDFPNPWNKSDRQMNRASAVASMLVGDERIDLTSQPTYIPDFVAYSTLLKASSFKFMGHERGNHEVLKEVNAEHSLVRGGDQLAVRYLVAIAMAELAVPATNKTRR